MSFTEQDVVNAFTARYHTRGMSQAEKDRIWESFQEEGKKLFPSDDPNILCANDIKRQLWVYEQFRSKTLFH